MIRSHQHRPRKCLRKSPFEYQRGLDEQCLERGGLEQSRTQQPAPQRHNLLQSVVVREVFSETTGRLVERTKTTTPCYMQQHERHIATEATFAPGMVKSAPAIASYLPIRNSSSGWHQPKWTAKIDTNIPFRDLISTRATPTSSSSTALSSDEATVWPNIGSSCQPMGTDVGLPRCAVCVYHQREGAQFSRQRNLVSDDGSRSL